MSYEEIKRIRDHIEEVRKEMKKEYKGGTIQYAILSELFDWFKNNGHCVFVTKKTKKLVTQTNISEIYIVKYGIKFEITCCIKYNPFRCTDLRIKLL